jgi:bleomycin hydrolase
LDYQFATLNTIRLGMAQKYQVEGLELSQAYLFFFDALEKANYFLENMLDLAQEPLDSREIQFLMTAPMVRPTLSPLLSF